MPIRRLVRGLVKVDAVAGWLATFEVRAHGTERTFRIIATMRWGRIVHRWVMAEGVSVFLVSEEIQRRPQLL
jgi:hypothetical protein